MGYDSENRSKMYFCIPGTSPGSTNRLVPAPQISINPEIYYSNDTVIGYTYNITLNGYAHALRRDQGDRAPGILSSGIEQTFSHMNDIRNIFKGNGGDLYLYDTGNKLVLQAKGATIKSIKFDESDNKWFNYSPYTIELEFNEIDFLGCNNKTPTPCTGSFFHTDQPKVSTSDNLVDFKKYKLKNFNDKWTISLDNELNTQYYFKVTYTISATGKHYYNSSGNLIPAWQQAKKFVQERLYQQIKALIDGAVALSNSGSDDGCAATLTAGGLYQREANETLFQGFGKSGDKYIIYNETINCNTSESAGSFSVTYNAIISAYDRNIGNENENGSIHTYTRNKSISQPTNKIVTTVSVQGTVQGLIKGGFIDDPNGFELPENGQFISAITADQSKYDNALAYYLNNIGGESDLNDSFKNHTDVNSIRQCSGATGRIFPVSFTLDHNYHEGSVSYSAQYDSNHDSEEYMTVTITEGDPTPMFNEFVIPFRSEGPLIQLLGCSNPRTLSINIEGAEPSNKNCNPSSIPNNIPYVGTILNQIGPPAGGGWIQTGAQYNNNLTDGSFSINLEYVNPN
jgi:hypothetical protein